MQSSFVVSLEWELAESLLDEIVDGDENMHNFIRKDYESSEALGRERVLYWPMISDENVSRIIQFLRYFPRRAWYTLQYFESTGVVWKYYGSGYIFLDHIPKLEMVW